MPTQMQFKKRLPALISAFCFLLACQAKAAPRQLLPAAKAAANAPNYVLFAFPNKAAVADIVYSVPALGKDGQIEMRWARARAQGQMRLPETTELKVTLRFDGLNFMDSLAKLDRLRITSFSAGKLEFEDKHMHYLQGFKDLRSLYMEDTLITDNSLSQIGLFSQLNTLDLAKTDVSGSGFDKLKNLHKLQSLSLEGTNIKPGNILKLKPLMPGLITLNISRTSLPKADAVMLKDLKLVQNLDLNGNSKIDDDCLKYLVDLKHLSRLAIFDTAITDKSMASLIKLRGLRTLIVRNATFWTTRKPLTKFGQVNFVDPGSYSEVPIEVFKPWH